MRIEGYKLISRHDRTDGRQGGGVAVFALEKLAHKVTHLGDSTVAEHSWVIVHSDHGPYVIGCWYRPPAPGEIESIRSLKEELQTQASRAVVECCAWRSQRPSSEVVEVLQQEQLGRRRTVLHLQRGWSDTNSSVNPLEENISSTWCFPVFL